MDSTIHYLGELYTKTGNRMDGAAVYAKDHEWERAIRSLGSSHLWVWDNGKMVPYSEYQVNPQHRVQS